MIVLANLTATSEPLPFRDSVGVLQGLRDETHPSSPRQLALCSDGLVGRRGDAAVAIPAAELWKLLEHFEPALLPPLPPAG